MSVEKPILKISQPIREIDFQGLKIGGDTSYSFMKENENPVEPLLALELPFFADENLPEVLKKQFSQDYNITEALKCFENLPNEIVSIRFNVSEENLEQDLKTVEKKLPEVFAATKKPLILRGRNNKDIDLKLLPLLAEKAERECIISFVDETTYEEILPSLVKHNHIVVIRTPIDINLAKEMNILTIDKGLNADKIIIDPDMGGLGYGLDYGYSVIEKLKQVALEGDNMLNMPVIAFIGEESFKAKEAKSDKYDKNWGEYEKRALMWELAGTSAILAAGVNIAVVWSENTVKTLKGLI